MKQIFLRSLTIVALALSLTLPALADTVRLKDGSVIRGQIVSFKNEQFTILVGSGARGRKSRITVYMEDVDSIEFDSAGSTGSSEETNTNASQPTYQPPPANTQPTNTQPTNPQPSYQPPPTTSSPSSGTRPSSKSTPACGPIMPATVGRTPAWSSVVVSASASAPRDG